SVSFGNGVKPIHRKLTVASSASHLHPILRLRVEYSRRRKIKKVIKTTLKIAGVIVVLLLALLAYKFAPVKLDVAANQTLAPDGSRGRPDPSQLPEVTLSILKAGKMPARQAFAYRGGSWGGGYENGIAAILVRHPQAAFLIDSGFGANVDQHWRTIP